ncbi:hypothetical protein CGRA01v4_14492 [Colletotrichum graminicola]|nr:hypothetical protein CGRA01v4_14492 [Colletotrichum graminicola]
MLPNPSPRIQAHVRASIDRHPEDPDRVLPLPHPAIIARSTAAAAPHAAQSQCSAAAAAEVPSSSNASASRLSSTGSRTLRPTGGGVVRHASAPFSRSCRSAYMTMSPCVCATPPPARRPRLRTAHAVPPSSASPPRNAPTAIPATTPPDRPSPAACDCDCDCDCGCDSASGPSAAGAPVGVWDVDAAVAVEFVPAVVTVVLFVLAVAADIVPPDPVVFAVAFVVVPVVRAVAAGLVPVMLK